MAFPSFAQIRSAVVDAALIMIIFMAPAHRVYADSTSLEQRLRASCFNRFIDEPSNLQTCLSNVRNYVRQDLDPGWTPSEIPAPDGQPIMRSCFVDETSHVETCRAYPVSRLREYDTRAPDKNGSAIQEGAPISPGKPRPSLSSPALGPDEEAWRRIRSNPTPEDLRDYLIRFQSGLHREEAQSALIAITTRASPSAERRIALVIGNGRYVSSPRLKNPENDAYAMAEKLRSLGFILVGGKAQVDVQSNAMRRLIRELGEDARPGDDALFYFSGHGVANAGENYLLPVDDADIKTREDVPDFAVSATSVLDRLKQRGRGVNILILDACRNNPLPLGQRSGERGLARMIAPAGTFIAYAASPGQTADDGNGSSNGLFTAAMLQWMSTPGLRIEDLMSRVLERVSRENAYQEPTWEAKLRYPFYFVAP